jgi:hypothetical protein
MPVIVNRAVAETSPRVKDRGSQRCHHDVRVAVRRDEVRVVDVPPSPVAADEVAVG